MQKPASQRYELCEATEEIARLESELRDARAAQAKSEQQATDLQAQLAKAGDVQKLLAGLEARLAPPGATAKDKK